MSLASACQHCISAMLFSVVLGLFLSADALVAGTRATSAACAVPRSATPVLQLGNPFAKKEEAPVKSGFSNPFAKKEEAPVKSGFGFKKVKKVTRTTKSIGVGDVVDTANKFKGLAFLVSVPGAAAVAVGGIILFAGGTAPDSSPFEFLCARAAT